MAYRSTRARLDLMAGATSGQDDAQLAMHWACGLADGGDVVCVGCGDGTSVIILGREGKTAVGLDRNPATIDRARTRLRDEEELVQQRVSFQVAEAHALPFDDSSFDTVLVGDLLRQLVDPKGALREAFRVLRVGGRLVITARYLKIDTAFDPDALLIEDLLDLLGPEFVVDTVEFLGGYWGLGSTVMAPGAAAAVSPSVLRQALRAAEQALCNTSGVVADEQHESPEVPPAGLEEPGPLVADLRDQIAALGDRLRRAEADSRDHQRALTDERSSLVRLEVQFGGAATERDRLRAAVSEHARAVTAANDRASAARTEIAKLHGQLEEITLREQTALAEREAGQARLEQAIADNAALETASRKAADRIAQLEGDLARSDRHATALQASLKSQRFEAERHREALLANNRRLTTSLDARRQELDAANAELRSLRDRLVTVGSEHDELRGRAEDLEAHAKHLVGVLHQKEVEVRARDSELHDLRQAHDRQSRTVVRLERTIARQEPQLATLAGIRGSRAYRLMSWLWRVNATLHPFRARRLRNEAKGDPDPRELPGRKEPSGHGPERSSALVATSAPAAPAPEPPATQAPAPSVPRRKLTTRQLYDTLDLANDRARFLAGTFEPSARHAPTQLNELRIAGILGRHVADGLAEVCDLVTFRPDNWHEILAARAPHLLLVESTFVGNHRSWQHRVAETIHPDASGLSELVDACRAGGSPTAFWFTRDVAEVGPFLRIMRAFDYIFAADPAAVDRIRQSVGADAGVHHLPLAGSPLVDVPHERTGVTYVPSSSVESSLQQSPELRALLEVALPFGLTILDVPRHGQTRSTYVDPLAQRVQPCNSRRALVTALSTAKVAIVEASPSGTLIPGPLYDAAAVGAAIVTTSALDLPPGLAENVVELSASSASPAALVELLEDDQRLATVAEASRRALVASHNYHHRLLKVASTVGVAIPCDE